MAALFTLLGDDRAVPTELSRGPWTPDALHGGPVAALFAWAIERHEAHGVDRFVARLTVELERPVPVEPLTWATETVRDGRKVSFVDAVLSSDRGVVARARALRIRAKAVPFSSVEERGPGAAERGSVSPGADAAPALSPFEAAPAQLSTTTSYPGFHNAATEHRFSRGDFQTPGPVFDWIRLRCPIVDGEVPSPLERVAAAADFANGISRVVPFDTHMFINPELTVHVFRSLVGEWVGMDSASHYGPLGVGLSDTALFDVEGRLGRSNQSLLLDTRS